MLLRPGERCRPLSSEHDLEGAIPDDHRLAAALAQRAGELLTQLRETEGRHLDPWSLRDAGDMQSHDLLVEHLARHRPFDTVLSEEGAEDRGRLKAARTWIVDPLDGTHDYPYHDSIEWAIHVALVEGGRPTAAAVSVPGMDTVFSTDSGPAAEPQDRPQPLVITGRSNAYLASRVAEAIGGRVTACGSSGVKAMLVVSGAVDVYIHGSGLFEWDVCAPAAVAEASGLVVTDIGGSEIVYNKPDPIVRGLVISRPEFADAARDVLDQHV